MTGSDTPTTTEPSWEAVCDALLRRLVAGRSVLEGDGRPEELALALPAYVADGRWDAVRDACDQDIVDAVAAFEAAIHPETRLGAICRTLDADRDSALLLAVLIALDASPTRRRLLRSLDGGSTPTVGFLAELLLAGPAAVDRTVGRLQRAGLVVVGSEAGWASRTVTPAAPLVSAAYGGTAEEPSLEGLVERHPIPGGDAPVVVTVGGDRESRRLRIGEELDARSVLETDQAAVLDRMDALVRHATLTGAAVLLHVDDALAEPARAWIDRADHLRWAISSRHELPLASLPRRAWVERRVTSAPPDVDALAGLVGERVAAGRHVSGEQLRLLRRTVPGLEDPGAGLRRLAGGELERLAVRITPRRTWSDLVLDPEREELLRDVVRRFRHRTTVYDRWGFDPGGRGGVTALFAGPPGTGKTLSAEVVAGELGLDLYRVDLASTVSKYIGETEKNLEAVFTAAEAAEVVLLFDEADAVFGKRSEVGDAHDRYANLETAYLLQRIERFGGIAVLTTNLQSNLDQAFLRRIDVSIAFSVPGPEERRRIWEASLAAAAPTDGVDVAFLAERFELAGGSIRNVALTAAFLAADHGTPITMRHVVTGIRRELVKHSRLVDGAQFGPYAPLLGDGTTPPV